MGPGHRPGRAFCGAPPVPPDVGERAAGHLGQDPQGMVMGAYAGKRRDVHVYGEVAAQRGRRPVRPSVRPPLRSAGERSAIRSSGQGAAPPISPSVPDQPLDAFLQESHRGGVTGQQAPQCDQFVDVLMGYGQVEQDLGEVVGVRQHGVVLPRRLVGRRPGLRPLRRTSGREEYVAERSSGPDAYGQ